MSDLFFTPRGHRLVILLDHVEKEEKTASGIIISKVGQTGKQEQRARAKCKVLAVGDGCWPGYDNEDFEPWCKEGDEIIIAQHAGQGVHIPENLSVEEVAIAERIRIILDDDVLGPYNPEVSLKEWCSDYIKHEEKAA